MKSVLASRTLWVNLIISLSLLLPTPIQEWVKANADAILIGSNLLNMLLRLITHKRLQLFPSA